jgi:hypothetical protein
MVDVTVYDDNILQQFADSLYQQAKWIVLWTASLYGLTAFLFSVALIIMVFALRPQMVSAYSGNTPIMVILVVTGAGIAAGANAGNAKAFNLKLQAQQILCQRQTEINTRGKINS